ncbi:MAG: hypothetical protein R2753_14220 [Chitinophagales bacterium]
MAQVKVYERSSKLRNYAIEHFTKKTDILLVSVVLLILKIFMEQKLEKDFIEIHHNKPIFQYEDSDIENTIENALNEFSTCLFKLPE